MTATEELIERITPDLKAAVARADGLNWFQRRIGLSVAPWLATLAIQILLSYAGPVLLAIFHKLMPILSDIVRPEYHADLDLANRLLSQSRLTYDPAVRAALPVPTAPVKALRIAP